MVKKIAILGSTGSIGKSAILLLENELKGKFLVEAISFHSNAKLALNQAMQVSAKKIIATSKEGFENIKKLYSGNEIQILQGEEKLLEVCRDENLDVILLAIVGVEGLKFALESIVKSKRILAIANKESIVCGFHLISKKLDGNQTSIVPVDSEHNSLFRLLSGVSKNQVESAFITASGGPFLGKNFDDLKEVTLQQVIKHPVWNMGSKISVDSATMANKGLELIEAYNLFNLTKIEAFVCKGSLLHAGIQTVDGSMSWFFSEPDMKNHISHAISGEVVKLNLNKFDLLKMQFVSLQEIKPNEFPIFFIAKKIAESKNYKLAISFNILNEIAVFKFLQNQIKYTQILNLIEENLLFNPENFNFQNVEEIFEYYKILQNKIS